MTSIDAKIKAQILVEALPYIQQYAGEIVVIKYGGNAMINEELKEAVIKDVVLLNLIGIKVVLVHGGGPEISEMLDKVGKESQFVNGLRCTDDETMDIVQMVLCGKVNKNLVSLLRKAGGRGVGLAGVDGSLFEAVRRDAEHGNVGNIVRVNPDIVLDVLEKGYIPVVSSIAAGIDQTMNYNINADFAAEKLAIALHAKKFILLTDVKGLMRDFSDEDSLIREVKVSQVPGLMKEGVIQQVGKPMELYDHPKNQFVAGFIGSPQMNFFDVTVENNVVTFADGNKITLPENVLQLLKGHEGSMTLGIRGEDIKTEDRYLEQYRENIQHAVITDTEVMGNENNLYFQFGGTQAVARVSKYEVAQVGDTIDFVFMPEKLHFFDKETGINYTEE